MERHRFQRTFGNPHLQSQTLESHHGFLAQAFALVVEEAFFLWGLVDLCFPVHIRG